MQIVRRVPAPIRRPRRAGLAGVGFDPFATAAAILPAVIGEGDAGMPGIPDIFGAGAGGGMPSVTVSPAIQTQISPQISPVFQQAFQPSGSPMTAGTTQTAPSTQSAAQPGAGTAGGFPDLGFPSAGGGYMPGSTYKTVPASDTYSQGTSSVDWQKWGFWLAAGVGVVVLIAVARKPRTRSADTGKPRTRSADTGKPRTRSVRTNRS